MELIPIQMDEKQGSWVLLQNDVFGHLVLINCLYVVAKCRNHRHAKKVAFALNKALNEMEWHDYFSSFRATILNGKFPAGAKMLSAPLRAATPAVVRRWLKEHLPEPIDASAYDAQKQEEDLYVRMFHRWGITSNPLFDGEMCSVA